MRLDLLRNLAVAGGLLVLPAAPASADNAADLKLCLTAGNTYDGDIEDACDRYLKAGAGKSSDRAKAYMARAKVVAADEDYDAALDDMDDAIALVPSNDAYLLRAFYLIKTEAYDDAVKDIDIVIKKDARNADAFYLRGRATYENGDYDNALDDFNQAIKLQPKHANAYLWRGHFYADDFELDDAIADYTSAIRYGAGADAYYARAETYYFNLQEREAIADLEEVLKQFPNDIESYRLRAECFEALEQYDQAIADYDALLRIKAKDDGALGARAAVFLKKKNTAAAIADYTEALGINSLKTYYVGRANAYQAGDDLDKAIADQNIVVTMSPGAGDYLRLGQLYVANNDGAGADLAFTNGLDLATKAVTANGNYASNFATRGDIYHAMKKDDLALADYNEAITRASSNAGYYEARATIEDALGNADAAAADRSKAAEIREASAEPAADTSSTDDAEDDEDDDSTEAPAKGSGSMRSIH